MAYLPVLAFAMIYGAATWRWQLSPLVGGFYLVVSLACYLVYAADKSAARAKARRTPESTLLMLGLACGWPGAILAQQRLRHKSVKVPFRIKFWLTVLVNIVAFLFLASRQVLS